MLCSVLTLFEKTACSSVKWFSLDACLLDTLDELVDDLGHTGWPLRLAANRWADQTEQGASTCFEEHLLEACFQAVVHALNGVEEQVTDHTRVDDLPSKLVCKVPGPSSYLFTAKQLLWMKLPMEDQIPQQVNEDGLEPASTAIRACPLRIKLWEVYEGEPLDQSIIQHMLNIDNTERSHLPLPPEMEPVRGDDMRESDVQRALENLPLDRLSGLLRKTPGPGRLRWKREMDIAVCETLAQSMCQAAGSANAAAGGEQAAGNHAAPVAAGAAATSAATPVATAAPAAAGAALAAPSAPGLRSPVASVAPSAVQETGAAGLMSEGTSHHIHASSTRPCRQPSSAGAQVHTVGTDGIQSQPPPAPSTMSSPPAGFALLWTAGPKMQPTQATPGQQPAAASSSSTAAQTPGAHPPGSTAWEQAASKYVAVGEVKRYEKLFRNGQPLDLCGLWHDSDCLGASVRRMLDQLFTGMVLTGVAFGWISCFYATWLAWRPLDDPECLMLSRAFLHDDLVPTAMAALSWLQAQGVRHWCAGKRHAPYQLQLELGGERSPGAAGRKSASASERDDQEDDSSYESTEEDDEARPRKRQRHQGSTSGQTCRSVPRLSAHDVVLGSVVGEGSSSMVVQGLCRGKPAAIKLLFGPDGADMAEREAVVFQVLHDAQVQGAIPTLFGCGKLLLGTPFIATSLVLGQPLSELTELSLSCFTPGVAATGKQALAAMHAAGVAHGDLEWCNIMLQQLPGISSASNADPSIFPVPDGDEAAISGLGGSSGTDPATTAAAEGPVRIMFIDLGRAYTDARPDELRAEMRVLKSMLRSLLAMAGHRSGGPCD